MTVIGEWQSYALLILVGFLPNELWRLLGFFVGGGIDESSEVLVWVRYIATAILAGVIAQLLIAPPGALAAVPAPVRYAAVAVGVGVFFATRRSTLAGVVSAEAALILGKLLLTD